MSKKKNSNGFVVDDKDVELTEDKQVEEKPIKQQEKSDGYIYKPMGSNKYCKMKAGDNKESLLKKGFLTRNKLPDKAEII